MSSLSIATILVLFGILYGFACRILGRNGKYVLSIMSLIFLIGLERHELVFLSYHLATILLSFISVRSAWPIIIPIIVQFALFVYAKTSGLVSADPVVPIGFAFFSLRVFSYLVEAKKSAVVRGFSFVKLLEYVYFFPSLISGPIQNANEYENAIRLFRNSPLRFQFSFLLIAVGFIKKFVISDNLFPYVSLPLNNPDYFSGVPLLFAVFLSKYLVYLDFSGYSDIARGVSKMMGINVPVNFSRPFFAKNLKEYWRSWHSSLSRFISTYVFMPLLVSPLRSLGLFGILAITYILLGLWHRFSILFVAYGVLQAILLYFDDKIFRIIEFVPRSIQRVARFILLYFIILSLPALAFRLSSFDEVRLVIVNLFSLSIDAWAAYSQANKVSILPLIFLFFVLEFLTLKYSNFKIFKRFCQASYLKKLGFYLGAILLVLYYASVSSKVDFVYSSY